MEKEQLHQDRVSCEIIIDTPTYLTGLMDTTEFLFTELQVFMTREGRNKGIVISYFKQLRQAYDNINEDVTEEDIETYGRVLYLLKPLIISEYRRLKQRLSNADAIITLYKKIIDIVAENIDGYIYAKEVKIVKRVLDRLWDNIKNGAKRSALFNFSNQIKYYKSNGLVGKYQHDRLNLEHVEKEKGSLNKPEEKIKIETGEIDLL